MYALNRLRSANHLAARFASAAAPIPPPMVRSVGMFTIALNPPLLLKLVTMPMDAAVRRQWSRGDYANEREMLPPELSSGVVRLECESSADGGVCQIYLVGTKAFLKSHEQIQGVMEHLKPQAVFLEKHPSKRLKDKDNDDFRVAYEEAQRHGGKVIFGNRPRWITLARYWSKISPSEPLGSHALEFDRELYKKDIVERSNQVVQIISKKYPVLMETFVHECDRYMSAKLLEVAREHNTVVAVVERVHLAGIVKHWKEPVEMKPLLKIPLTTRNAIAMGVISAYPIFTILSSWYST